MKHSHFLLILMLFIGGFIGNGSVAAQTKSLEKIELAALEFVLSPENRKLYKEMSDFEKKEWANQFWRAMDPTPTTTVNEYYEEFKSRVAFAYDHYHSMQPPYFIDDRGKYYIKYGPPDDKVESAGVGKVYKNNETWVYYGYNLFIDFVEFTGFGYREVTDLSEAITGAPLNEKVRLASALYMERAELSDRYLRFRQVKNDLDYFGEVQEISQEKQIAAQKAPPVTYSFRHNVEPLTVRLASCVFKGTGNKSRVELYYSVPLREIAFEPENDANILTSSLLKHIFLFDQSFKQILKKSENFMLYARPGDNLSSRSYINQHVEELNPGNYYITMQFENPESKRVAILKSELRVRSFPAEELAISDIELAYQVKEQSEGQYLKPNNLQVVPYISSVIDRQRPIMIYYEIYNLHLDSDKRTKFEVSYDLIHLSDEGGFVKELAAKITNFLGGSTQQKRTIGSSFQSSGTSSFEQLYSSIDFSKAKPGKKRFVVRVTDLHTGKKVSSRLEFTLR